MQYRYEFEFDDGRKEAFELTLDDTDLSLAPLPVVEEADWMALEYSRCENCTLDSSQHTHCPVARNLAHVLMRFSNDRSFTPVTARARTQDRMSEKSGPLEECVSSIMGLIMATSGCPVLDYLKPMAFTHLPFANVDETVCRAISTYLMAQAIRAAKGKQPRWEVSGLAEIYDRVNKLNAAFVERLRGMKSMDANVNALVSLDLFAQFGLFALPESWIEQFEGFFGAYLKD